MHLVSCGNCPLGIESRHTLLPCKIPHAPAIPNRTTPGTGAGLAHCKRPQAPYRIPSHTRCRTCVRSRRLQGSLRPALLRSRSRNQQAGKPQPTRARSTVPRCQQSTSFSDAVQGGVLVCTCSLLWAVSSASRTSDAIVSRTFPHDKFSNCQDVCV